MKISELFSAKLAQITVHQLKIVQKCAQASTKQKNLLYCHTKEPCQFGPLKNSNCLFRTLTKNVPVTQCCRMYLDRAIMPLSFENSKTHESVHRIFAKRDWNVISHRNLLYRYFVQILAQWWIKAQLLTHWKRIRSTYFSYPIEFHVPCWQCA